jgi:hypothetical protein
MGPGIGQAAANLQTQINCMKTRRNWPSQTTWVMRQLGSAFNPDTVCQYTGLALHMFPMEVGDGQPQFMGFWRTDGELCGCYPCTDEEKAWILSNPDSYNAERIQFEAWLREVRSTRKKP